jgi:peptidoglycan hydrolase CwlO-like protein
MELINASLSNNHIPVERSKQAIYKKYRDLKKNQKPLRNFINKLEKEKLDLQKEKVDLEAALKKEKEEKGGSSQRYEDCQRHE